MYEIRITGTPLAWNKFLNSRGGHWAYYRYAKDIKSQIMVAHYLLEKRPTLPLPGVYRSTFDCGFADKRRRDICDLCTKPHLDALVQLQVITDDNKNIIRESGPVKWHYSKEPETIIRLEEL